MTEDEIIKVITYKLNMKNTDVYAPILYDEIQSLLNLYNKEKEKNSLLLANNNGYYELKKYVKQNYISKDKIRNDLEVCKKVYEQEMKPYMIEIKKNVRVLNITGLSKKEKEELVNKRNCLLTQIRTYEMLLEE